MVFKSIKLQKFVSTNAKKRVTPIPTFLTTCGKPKIPHDSTKYIGEPILVFPDKSMADVTDVARFFQPWHVIPHCIISCLNFH